MKKIIFILTLCFAFASCEAEKEAKRIAWTTNSAEANALFEEFLVNIEHSRWDPEVQEMLFDSILSLDPDFHMAKTFGRFKPNEERRKLFLSAYNNRSSLSDLELRLIESQYEIRINGNRINQDKLLDQIIEDYPEYFQLRIWSGDVKNNFDVKASEKRWEEALEINPKSFQAYVNLAFLHFPTGDFSMLAEDERDIEKAENLLKKGSEIYPESSRWPRFLGNIYRGKGEFEQALDYYKKSLDRIENFETGAESGPYANSLMMIGHVNTFQGNYSDARDYYQNAIDISNNWWKVQIAERASHTYIYEKDFSKAVLYLSKMQDEISKYDEEEITIINWTNYIEFTKFLAFGHSQKEEESRLSIEKIESLRRQRLEIQLSTAIDDNQKERFILNSRIDELELQMWFKILFGNYEEARSRMVEYKKLKTQQLAFNQNAMNRFHKFEGYLNLMEGNPEESIAAYGNLSKQAIDQDGYHSYFLALAKRAVGQHEESKEMFIRLANNHFSTWQNAFVKNLAKAQIKTNL